MPHPHHLGSTILLTGFAPFPGVEHNPSTDLARAIATAARRSLPDWRVVDHVLPTEWRRGPEAVAALYAEFDPAIAVHFGVATQCDSFEVEMRADNRTIDMEDAEGAKAAGPEVVAGGPGRIPVSLPTRRILWRLRSEGIASKLSMDCGGYICNAVLYHALARSRADGSGRRLGFVHVPKTLAIGRAAPPDGRPPRLTAHAAIAAGVALLDVTLAAGGMLGERDRAHRKAGAA